MVRVAGRPSSTPLDRAPVLRRLDHEVSCLNCIVCTSAGSGSEMKWSHMAMGKHENRPLGNCSSGSIGALYQSERRATARIVLPRSVAACLVSQLHSSVSSELADSLSRGRSSRHTRLSFHLFFAPLFARNFLPSVRQPRARAQLSGHCSRLVTSAKKQIVWVLAVGSDDLTHSTKLSSRQ